MKLIDIYKKDINRHIEGVIKVDDIANTANEVDEYVITAEVGKRLETFFEVYSSSINSNVTDIGVWLSGFFGSGKSHLLKMISYILENREIGGKRVGEIFLEKVDEAFLKANIQKALTLPTKTILFNIDQKSNIGNQHKAESLLPVFIKVMNELQGFSTIPVVAEFEIDLEKQGIYEEFKSKYEAVARKSWEKGKTASFLEEANIAKALAEVKGTTTEFTSGTLNKYKDKVNQVSIEDFALRVKDYIDKQEKDFRLIFCVDEMGQFISDNSKLMLNLQTISESLATKCKNQAWILVTSQEKIEDIIGDMNKSQASDFSKIQGRFPTKMNLSSKNADEVIQKRLLVKTDDATFELEKLYEKEKNNFRALISFSEMPTYQTFNSPKNFVYNYPFIPYQYQLFEYSILGLSRHNAFQGRHQSVGERSMLSVFQIIAQELSDKELGALATYDQFYDGLRATIRSEAQKPVISAEKNLENKPFAVQVLKALFMIKYVGNKFKATKHNISRLLVNNFDVDPEVLEKNVQEALNLLEYETYVQQIAGVYEFLTDDEKDIENEIKTTDIELSEVKKELNNYIFGQIIPDKIRVDDQNQDYKFGRKLDDLLMGRPEELCINFITPLYDREVDEIYLNSKSINSRDSDVIIHMKDDPKLRQEIEMILKTEKYIRIKNSPNMKENVRAILANKSGQNNERSKKVVSNIEDLIANSTVYLNGSILDIRVSDAKTKIKQAFQSLIRNVYLNLKMLDTVYKEENLNSILLSSGNDIFYADDGTMSEAEHEMQTHIQRKKLSDERVTVKSLDESLSKKPYGWPQISTLCILAKLFVRKKIEASKDNNELDNKELFKTLKNSKDYISTFVEPVRTIDNKKVVALKNFHSELFHQQNSELEAKEVHKKFVTALEEEIKGLEVFYYKRERYKFLEELSQPIKFLKEVMDLGYVELYEKLNNYEDKLLDLKEEVIDKLKSFMNTERKVIYDEVISFLSSENANLEYLPSENTDKETLLKVKEDLKPYKSQLIKEAKTALDNSKAMLNQQLQKEKEESQAKVDEFIKRFEDNEDYLKLKDNQKDEIIRPFTGIKQKLPNEKLISDIRYKTESDLNQIYQKQLGLLNKFIDENKPKLSIPLTSETVVKTVVKTEIVQITKVLPNFKKLTLDNEDDVLTYSELFREKLLQEIRNNKKISL